MLYWNVRKTLHRTKYVFFLRGNVLPNLFLLKEIPTDSLKDEAPLKPETT